MRDDVLDLLGSLAGFVNGSGGIRCLKLNLLDDSVDNVRLQHVGSVVVFKFFHDSNDHHGQFLVFIKTNFDFSLGLGLGSGGFGSGIAFFGSGWVDLGMGNLFLVFSILLFSLISVKFILDVCFKFNIILLDVDVRLLQKSADLFHVSSSDHRRAMSSSECLRESNQRLEVSYSHWISLSLLLVSLSDCFILIFQNDGGLLSELWIDCSCELDISL